jgi:hypothetical protein
MVTIAISGWWRHIPWFLGQRDGSRSEAAKTKLKKKSPGHLGYTIAGVNASFYIFLDLCENL